MLKTHIEAQSCKASYVEIYIFGGSLWIGMLKNQDSVQKLLSKDSAKAPERAITLSCGSSFCTMIKCCLYSF